MKVYSLEGEYEMEEDFGGFQTHIELIGVFPSREEAVLETEKTCNKGFVDFHFKEWDV